MRWFPELVNHACFPQQCPVSVWLSPAGTQREGKPRAEHCPGIGRHTQKWSWIHTAFSGSPFPSNACSFYADTNFKAGIEGLWIWVGHPGTGAAAHGVWCPCPWRLTWVGLGSTPCHLA